MLDFAVELLDTYMARLDVMGGDVILEGRLLHAAGLAAQRFNASMANSGRTIAREAHVQMFNHYHNFVVLFEKGGGV